jgi:glutamate/tyrosine decarboxylase-like PLP-dependent enzyme
MANFSALAAARSSLLEKAGWDVEAKGLFGAPEIQVIVGAEVHASVLKALAMLGLGKERVIRLPVDNQGRLMASHLPSLDGPTIICLQAGNVNSGASDPVEAVCRQAAPAGAWVHIDGAFGLWAAASPAKAHLIAGVEKADSWATDCHKWLNVPYDCGIVFCKQPETLRAAMTGSAAYLLQDENHRESFNYTPEMSRRARGVEVWAALKSLGRTGLEEMIDRTCRLAVRFADGLERAGFQVLNEVVLNQVLVSFGDSRTTQEVIAGIQNEGTCWGGGTEWRGQKALRLSVSSWATREEDIDLSLDAIQRVVREIKG